MNGEGYCPYLPWDIDQYGNKLPEVCMKEDCEMWIPENRVHSMMSPDGWAGTIQLVVYPPHCGLIRGIGEITKE